MATLPDPMMATYNEANRRMTYNEENLVYDENGNLIQKGDTVYTWDVRNQLVGIDSPIYKASFKYDALGRRIEKTINGKTTQYLYDGLDIIQEIEGGMVTANYIRTLNIDEPLARIKSDGTIRYYQQDAIGSVVALTDESGTVKTTYTYDPYGNTTMLGEPSDNPIQYTGRENDYTGLYYYRARYYDAKAGRFISEDSLNITQVLLLRQNPNTSAFADWIYIFAIRNPQVLNKYPYTTNSPLNYTDPYGLVNWKKVWTGIGLQFTGYDLIGTGVGVTTAAAIFEGPVSAVHVGTTPGVAGMIGIGGFTWWQGTKLIYEGFAEYEPEGGCHK